MNKLVYKTGIFLWLLLCSAEDIKYRKLCIFKLMPGAVITAILLLVNGIGNITELLSACAIGTVFLMAAAFSKGSFGLGDGIVLCILSVGLGLYSYISVVGYTLLYTIAAAGILLLFKQCRKNLRLPFVPFLFAGYFTNLIAELF